MNEIEQKLYDYLSGKADFDSKAFVGEVNDNPALRRILQNLKALPQVETVPDKERMIFIVKARLEVRRRRQIRVIWGRVAAVAILLVVVGALFVTKKPQTVESVAVFYTQSQGHEDVMLILANGETVSVIQIDSLGAISEGNTDIHLTDQGRIEYAQKAGGGDEMVYHTLKIPRKQSFRLLLSDNTEVWLNSQTEIRYPASFHGGERKVYVSGEAFFNVAKDPERPFLVVADRMEVEVLGTSFNVNTYMDEGVLTTTLVNGSLRIRDTVGGGTSILMPNQQAAVGEGGITINSVDASQVAGWMSGQFLYSDITLGTLCKYLERQYDVQIRFDDPTLRHYLLTGIVRREHSFPEVCEHIEETTRIRFDIKDRNITVYRAK